MKNYDRVTTRESKVVKGFVWQSCRISFEIYLFESKKNEKKNQEFLESFEAKENFLFSMGFEP